MKKLSVVEEKKPDWQLPLYEVAIPFNLVVRLRAADENDAKLKTLRWNLWLGGPDEDDEMKPQKKWQDVFENVAWWPESVTVVEVVDAVR